MIIDINKSIVSIEKILKIEKDWEDKGFVKFPQNFDFKGAYMELLQWFDWDIKKYPYVDIDKDESESLYPENIHIKLEKDYSLVVLLTMVILYYCENEVSINNNNLKEIDAFITNACGCQYFVDREIEKVNQSDFAAIVREFMVSFEPQSDGSIVVHFRPKKIGLLIAFLL